MFVRTAADSFLAMATVSIVHFSVMRMQGGGQMNRYINALTAYLAALSVCRELLEKKIITKDEYEILRISLAEKYGCSPDTIFAKIT